MDHGSDPVEVVLEAIAEQWPVCLVHKGVAWEVYPTAFRAWIVSGVCRIFGSESDRIERDFDLRQVEDVAAMVTAEPTPDTESVEGEDYLFEIHRQLIAKASAARGDPIVERALRKVARNIEEANSEIAYERNENGSQPGTGDRAAPFVHEFAAGATFWIRDGLSTRGWLYPFPVVGSYGVIWDAQRGQFFGADDGAPVATPPGGWRVASL